MIATILYQTVSITGDGWERGVLALTLIVLAAYALWFALTLVEWRREDNRVRAQQAVLVGALLVVALYAIIGCVWSCECDWTNLWCAI